MSRMLLVVFGALAVALGLAIGLGIAQNLDVLQPDPKIVEVTHSTTVREQPIIHNNTIHVHEDGKPCNEENPCDEHEEPGHEHPDEPVEPVLPDTGGQVGAEAVKHGTNRGEYIGGTRYRDLLYGRGGRDHLQGFQGDDLLDGGPGIDLCTGDQGHDRYVHCNNGQF